MASAKYTAPCRRWALPHSADSVLYIKLCAGHRDDDDIEGGQHGTSFRVKSRWIGGVGGGSTLALAALGSIHLGGSASFRSAPPESKGA
jgi:hypothetical protein